jgi:hypothetical protein
MTITETIRQHLTATSETLYRVAKDTEIAWSTLKRFADGGGLRSDQMDKLAEYFKLELRPIGDSKPAKKSTKK